MDSQICPGCGEANPADARLCGMCGAPLQQDEAVGEVHREVTLVTSDLKGSTALGERLGRTSTTDLPRLSRPNQTDLKDLRRRRPAGEAGARA